MVMMVKCTCGVEPPFNQSHLSNQIYIPAASKDPCYDLEAMLSKGMPWYAIAASLSQTKKITTGYGGNDVDSTIFGRDGWRRAEQQKL